MSRTLIRSMRVPFLALTPACVLLGTALAYRDGFGIEPAPLLATLAGALSAHLAVNTLNEYLDFRSGLDLRTQKTPFSGGSGALVADPGAARQVLGLSILCLGVTIACGLYLATLRSWSIVPYGLLGMATILSYTSYINRSALLCLLAPGFGFGLLMVLGSYFALSGQNGLNNIYAAAIVFFLVNNLLLLNQFPDIEADRAHGRNHAPIAYGKAISSTIYLGFAAAAALCLAAAISFDSLPQAAYLGLLPLLGALKVYRDVGRRGQTIEGLVPSLALNVAITLLVPSILIAAVFAA